MTEIMGILNLTPDSFSGDGLHGNPNEALLARAEEMAGQGAHIIDIGAESTRPGATMLTADEEWQRIAPLASLLAKRKPKALFSLDSYHPQNAQRAVEAGFDWVNDVSGGSPAMLEAVADTSAQLVLMHSLSVPADKTKLLPVDADPVEEVLTWGKAVLARCEHVGISRDRIILDPGIGFGKSAEQSLALIRNISAFKAWGVRLLVGHSRKSFLSLVLTSEQPDRDEATLAISRYLSLQGVDYLRVHDVRVHSAMLQEALS